MKFSIKLRLGRPYWSECYEYNSFLLWSCEDLDKCLESFLLRRRCLSWCSSRAASRRSRHHQRRRWCILTRSDSEVAWLSPSGKGQRCKDWEMLWSWVSASSPPCLQQTNACTRRRWLDQGGSATTALATNCRLCGILETVWGIASWSWDLVDSLDGKRGGHQFASGHSAGGQCKQSCLNFNCPTSSGPA